MTTGGWPFSQEEGKGSDKAILIYDSECPVCRTAVDWIRGRSAPETFEFFSCHDESLPARFPNVDKSECLSAAHLLLPGGKVIAGEKAAPEVFLRIPGYRWIARILRFPGARGFSRVFYRWFARRRHAISYLFHPGHGNG